MNYIKIKDKNNKRVYNIGEVFVVEGVSLI